MFPCPNCRAILTEADLSDSRCSRCGHVLPEAGMTLKMDSGEDEDIGGTVTMPDEDEAPSPLGGTVQFSEGRLGALAGRTISMDDSSDSESDAGGTVPIDEEPDEAARGLEESGRTVSMDESDDEEVAEAFGTVPIDEPEPETDDDARGREESGRTVSMDESDDEVAEDFGTVPMEDLPRDIANQVLGTVNFDDGSSFGGDALNTVNMDLSDPGSTADAPRNPGALRTVSMEGGALLEGDAGGTVPLPDEGIHAPDEAGAMRTISMSGDEAPSEDLSLKTVDMSDATGPGGRAIADMSQSALFHDPDARLPEGSGSGGSQKSPASLPSSGSARPSDDSGSASALKGLSDATGDTYISDDWADPGIGKTMAASPEAVKKQMEQIVKTIWMGAAKEKPLTSLKGKELKKKVVRPATGTPLVIKPRVLRKKEDSLPGEPVEYELLKILGEGGMGVVYDARQTSIDREVALKMLKGTGPGDEKARQKFLAEAVVTGDLDHPNIVPIYDVGTNDKGHLFYSMKKVKGTPWQKLLPKKSHGENLEILMKVADAVAFAHARGVVHRDLKPENVMLGDYGEVLVMDWGLAQSLKQFQKRSTITENAGMGGTPAYMAPEMATGPIDRIGPHSDVYLLGAILYEIVTGKPPHTGKNAMMCLMGAAKNEIVPTDKTGELVDVALKSMATKPEDRYPSVIDFQNAIREYLSHTESIALSTRAIEDMEQAEKTKEYTDYGRAVFGFQEAIELWHGNEKAHELLRVVRLRYAGTALAKGDYDLGAGLLDPQDKEHAVVLKQIRDAEEDREKRKRLLKYTQRAAIGLIVAIFVGGGIAYYFVDQQRQEAVKQKGIADKQTEEAKKQAKIAQDQTEEAKKQTGIANEQTAEAKKQTNIANTQRAAAVEAQKSAQKSAEAATLAQRSEEEEAYIARIGLASAKIKENAFDTALALLDQCVPKGANARDLRNWEWGRLMHLCRLDSAEYPLDSEVDALAISPDGSRFVVGLLSGKAQVYDIKDPRKSLFDLPGDGQAVHAAAFSPDGRFIATGGSTTGAKAGSIRLWDAKSGAPIRSFTGQKGAVVSVVFSKKADKLLTAGYDDTARLWDVESGREIATFEGHAWTVWTAVFSPDEKNVLTASADGTARIWAFEKKKDEVRGRVERLERVKTVDQASTGPVAGEELLAFRGHNGPVYSAVFSPDGRRVVSGGHDKRVLVWNPVEVQAFDFETVITSVGNNEQAIALVPFTPFDGHNGPVRSVAFSDDGNMILSAAQDNTVRLWDVDSRSAVKTLRKHSKLVRNAVFLPENRGVLSASHDKTVRLWTIPTAAGMGALPGGEEFRVLTGTLRGHQNEILAASFSRDSKAVVTASRDRTARTWNLETGEIDQTLEEGHKFLASAAICFPDGQSLVTSAVDGTVRIWDVSRGTELHRLDNTGMQSAVALSSDGQWILTGWGQPPRKLDEEPEEWRAQLWDARNPGTRPLFELKGGHTKEITAVAFTSDSRTIVTADAAGGVIVWDFVPGTAPKRRHQLVGHEGAITALVTLRDRARVLVASSDKSVDLWDLDRGELVVAPVMRHPQAVLSMDVSPDGRSAVTACGDGSVRLWNMHPDSKADLFATLTLPPGVPPVSYDAEGTRQGGIDSVRFSPDGKRIGGVDSKNRNVYMWDALSGSVLEGELSPFLKFTREVGRPRVLSSLAFVPANAANPNAYLVTVGGTDGRLWSSTGTQIMDYTPPNTMAAAGFSPDGTQVVTGSWDKSARVWDAKTGRDLLKLEGHVGLVNSATFSPKDGRYILTSSEDATARLWDGKTGKWIRTFSGHTEPVYQAVFNTDGTKVLTASRDRTARLWDVETGAQEKVFQPADKAAKRDGHEGSVRCVAVSVDGSHVLTGSEDGTAILWDAKAGTAKWILRGHTAAVVSVALSPDGKRVLTGSGDNNAKLWDAEKGKEILTLDGHTREVSSVSFSSDGHLVLTGSRDNTARVWLTTDWTGGGKVAAK